MEQNNQLKRTPKQKMLLVLPLLVIPFATMFFWALGGGKSAQAQSAVADVKGLNMQLPGAKLKNDSAENKLGFYEQAEKDSLKFRQAQEDDPYYKDGNVTGKKDSARLYDTGITPGMYMSSSASTLAADEQQINRKLEEIRLQMNQPQQATATPTPGQSGSEDIQLSRLKAAMQKMNTADAPDPQMAQLSGMLDKILYIEHPDLAKEKIREQSLKNKKEVFTVSAVQQGNEIQLMQSGPKQAQAIDTYTYLARGKHGKYQAKKGIGYADPPNAFYDWSSTGDNTAENGNTVSAVAAETRTIVNGATIKLRLLNDIYINGTLVPRDGFVYGNCSISGDRLQVNISSIRSGNSIFPVALAVYDMDGMNGLYIPDAISRQVAKGSADQGINGIDLYSFDNSIKGQAASAGVQAAKSLFSKKAQLVKVTVREGYRVFLKNTNDL